MTRSHNGRFACDPISRIGRTEQQARLQQRRQAVLARVQAQAARLPRGPAQCVLALTFINRSRAAMNIFGNLGDQWTVNGNTASMRLDDGRTLEIWLGEKIVEVSCCDADGVAFTTTDDVDHLLSLPTGRMADAMSALVDRVIAGSGSRTQPDGLLMALVTVRHIAVVYRIKNQCERIECAELTPMVRQLVRSLYHTVRSLVWEDKPPSPISADVRQELAVLQLKLYDLSAADMGVNTSTMLGNMIGALLSGDAEQQRKALGWK